ncbi:MAG: hypothetical protein ABIO43_12785 [Sphingomicrobium sp.]
MTASILIVSLVLMLVCALVSSVAARALMRSYTLSIDSWADSVQGEELERLR